ncbi:MAG: hypothetical protein DLM73_06450 [Chthoniobacterales bacterium]|nr:MAG: hypothetical protein DLM73_06450 [Chthoniobacterales bacterium]
MLAGQHFCAIESESLRTEIGSTRGVEYVHAHVIGVRPDTDVRVVKKVGAEVKAVTVVSAGGVGRGRDGDALIGDRPARNAGELADQPAVGQVIVEHDWIAMSAGFTDAAKAGPDRRDALGPQDGSPRVLVENLIAFVDDLNILGGSHGAIGIGWGAVAADPRERDTIEIANR